MDLLIRCSCGALRGVARQVSATAGNHVICYCDDCQSFARYLGRAADVLDENGGTEIFQMSQAKLTISFGLDRLTCMRLSPRGMFRWYARCCNTPIGNTLSTSKLPFVGLIHSCIQRTPGHDSLEAELGPVLTRAFRKFACGDTSKIPGDRIPLPLLVIRFVWLMLIWKRRRDGRRSVFFDAGSGQPVVSPRVLDAAERAAFR